MTKKICFKFDKIIRDKIIDLMEEQEVIVHTKKLDKNLALEYLKSKLIEESNEVIDAKNLNEIKEELSDVLEVIHGFCNFLKINFSDIEKIKNEKKKSKGGFEQLIYVSNIELPEGHPLIEKYLERSKYKEINN